MRIAIDAHAIGQHLTGNEVYIRSLLRSLAGLDVTAEFLAYISVPQARAELPASVRSRLVSQNPFRRLGWQMTRHLRHDLPDVLHVQYTAPLACPVPVIASVHDVSFLDHPEFFSSARAAQLRLTVSATVRLAARILTPSEFSRREIERHYPHAQGRTDVAYNAVGEAYRVVNKEQARARVRSRHGIPAPFVLNVGDLQSRKNQTGLIGAFESLLREHPKLPHHLVLVGQSKWEASAVKRAAERSPAASRIHMPGYVTEDDLRFFYNACDLFVLPSFYEGFGIPILEAMACGAPVACSDTSAMPEVADGAALFFDPRSPGAIMRAMRDLLVDAELSARLARRGQARAAQFSWARTARKTLAVYYAAAGFTPAGSPAAKVVQP